MSKLQDFSLCHLADVEVNTEEKNGATTVIPTCADCGKQCDVFHGTEAEAKKHQKTLKSQNKSKGS